MNEQESAHNSETAPTAELNSYLVAEMKTLGSAYGVLNSLAPSTRVLDFGPIGDEAIIILQDSYEVLGKVQSTLLDNVCVANTILPATSKPAMDAYFSLNAAEIGKSMLVAESSSVVQIFRIATVALENSATLLELRKIRGHRGLAYLCFSPTKPIQRPAWFDGVWTEVTPVNSVLKNYF